MLMSNVKLALGLSGQYGLPAERQIELYRAVGFNGIFLSCDAGADISGEVRAAEKYSMEIGSIHAPFMHCDAMWHESDKTDIALEELLYTVRCCGKYGIPVAVMHAFIGFDRHEPTKAGIVNFTRVVEEAERLGASYSVGNLLSSDVFYNDNPDARLGWTKMGVLGVEMEAAALYMNAARLGRRALAVCTVSDHLITGESLDADLRQTSFTEMMEIALNAAIRL
jgi:hypothetical protein